MDNRPIGVFDSGLGGLTALKELIEIMPHEDFIYFGDTGRIPYGTKSSETVIKYTRQDINFLKSFDIKGILTACGTASSVALPVLKEELDIPVYGVVESACYAAYNSTKNKRIGILGTQTTIKSKSYEKLLISIDKDIEVFAIPCPMFVPLVENGYIDSENEVSNIIVKDYVEPLIENGVDTVILGCTHYPLLSDIIQKHLGENVTLINSGKESAKNLAKSISSSEKCSESKKGTVRFFVSDAVESFSKTAQVFLGREISDVVEKIDIEKF
ncbi:MAG: glutamate racemase [Clostridia bacterium]|nr:glutamate racemase [Clostridia bacterium]